MLRVQIIGGSNKRGKKRTIKVCARESTIFLATFLKDFVLAICIRIQVTRNNFENFEMFSKLISSKFKIGLSSVTTLMSDDIATHIVSGS
jgi:hypothetical protein